MPPAWQLMLFISCVGMFGVGAGDALHPHPRRPDEARLPVRATPSPTSSVRSPTRRCSSARCAASPPAPGSARSAAGSSTASRGLARAGCRCPTWAQGSSSARASPCPPRWWVSSAGWPPRGSGANGWLGANEPFRRLGFLVGLASIMGAALVDLTLIARQAIARARAQPSRRRDGSTSERGGFPTRMLIAWVLFWAGAVVLVATGVMHQPARYILFGLGAEHSLRLHQRHLHRGQRPESHLQRLRRLGAADVGDGAAQPGGGHHRGDRAPHLQLGRGRHAAGSVDRLAPRDRPPRRSSTTRCSASAWARCSAWCWPASSCTPTRCWR